MRKKLLVASFFVLMTSFIISKENYLITANGLYVRKKPQSNSPIINMIPFGTSVSVIRTSIKKRIGKYNSYWYKLNKPLIGYVYGAFLSKNISKKRRMILCSETYNIEFGKKTKIILSQGYVIKISFWGNTSLFVIRKGRYKIFKNGIRLKFTRTLRITDEKSTRRVYELKSKISIQDIFWIPRIKGFVDKTFRSLLKKKPNMKTIKNMTAFDANVYIKDDKGKTVVAMPGQNGFLTDRYWINFTLPIKARKFINSNKW